MDNETIHARRNARAGGILTGALTGLALVLLWKAVRSARRLDLFGRSVLILGGSRGLGLEMAREFAARGSLLALVARSETELSAAADELRRSGAEVITHVADLTRREDVFEAVEAAIAAFGRLDVLVNNAGVIQVGPLEHMTDADVAAAMAIHFWAPYHAIRAAWPHMRRQGGGRIVNISSIGGKVAVPHLAPYTASKFALTGLSDAARSELGPDGILVTTVCPGLMRTGSPIKGWLKGQHEKEFAWFDIGDSLPLLSIDARRAARRIVDACEVGQAELIITPQARAAVIASAVAPGLVAAGQKLAARVLPDAVGPEGDVGRSGASSRSSAAPSWLTALGDRAAAANLELVDDPRPPSTG